MALSRVLSRPMSSTKMLSHLINPIHSGPKISPPQPTRSFHVDDGFEPHVSVDRKPIENRFQVSGPITASSVFKVGDSGYHGRYDMPGVDRRIRVWRGKTKHGEMLWISGWSPYDIREKDDAHLMQFIRVLPDGKYKLDQIKAKIKDGVVRVFVPLKVPAGSCKTE